jgi:hypothetical protein
VRIAEHDNDDPIVAYHDCTISTPTEAGLQWLNRLADTYGDAAVADALRKTWLASPDRQTFLSRTETALTVAERHRQQDDEARRKKAEAEYQRKERERIESMSEEQRKANMARLKEAMSGIGGST